MTPSNEGQLRDEVVEMRALVARLRDENGRLLREVELAGSVRGSDEELIYVGSKTRKKFHRANCKWATYIPDWKRIEFGSHREAREAGYKPCGTCRA